ncbi:MAG: ABC transporter permease [Flavobacteriales bacterium]|nr:ABC transporter permease [Flavobacteriales bacterium]
MSSLRHIIFREWNTRVRRKAFIYGTLAIPLLLMAVMGVTAWLEQSQTQSSKVLVVDVAGMVSRWDNQLEAWIPICPECFPERTSVSYRFALESMSDEAFLASDIDIMVVFDDAILQHHKAQYFFDKVPPIELESIVENDLSSAIERFKVQEMMALDYEAYKRLKTDVSLTGRDIITRDGHALGRSIVGFFFSLFLFMQILIYGMHVMRGVIEEKANRIVEVVISIVQPSQLMAGKVIGIGLVGLTQFALLTILTIVLVQGGAALMESMGWLTPSADASISLDFKSWMAGQSAWSFLLDVNWGLMLFCTALFYAGGFALYAASFAAIGAAVDQESDAQYFLLPVMIPLLASYILAILAIENPEGTLAVVGSFVPFTAPVMMLIRIPLGVPWWEVALSLGGVFFTAWLMLRIAGRVYRVGILMHGKRPNWRELYRWMTYHS